MEKSGAFCPALRCELQALSLLIAREARRLDPNKNRSAFSTRSFFNGLLERGLPAVVFID